MQLWAADSCGKSNQGSSPSKRQHSTKTQKCPRKCPMKHHEDQLRIATDCNDVLALEMDIVCHGCQAFIGFIHLLWMQPSRRDGNLWSCHFLNPGKIEGMFDNLGTHWMCIETFLAWPIVKRIGLHLDYFPRANFTKIWSVFLSMFQIIFQICCNAMLKTAESDQGNWNTRALLQFPFGHPLAIHSLRLVSTNRNRHNNGKCLIQKRQKRQHNVYFPHMVRFHARWWHRPHRRPQLTGSQLNPNHLKML